PLRCFSRRAFPRISRAKCSPSQGASLVSTAWSRAWARSATNLRNPGARRKSPRSGTRSRDRDREWVSVRAVVRPERYVHARRATRAVGAALARAQVRAGAHVAADSGRALRVHARAVAELVAVVRDALPARARDSAYAAVVRARA